MKRKIKKSVPENHSTYYNANYRDVYFEEEEAMLNESGCAPMEQI